MLFDVILMRRDGEKLDADKLPPPVRGLLSIARHIDRETDQVVITAQLQSERSGYSRGAPYILTHLQCCQLTRMDHRGMVLTGREKADDPKTVQAWWCITVHGAEIPKLL